VLTLLIVLIFSIITSNNRKLQHISLGILCLSFVLICIIHLFATSLTGIILLSIDLITERIYKIRDFRYNNKFKGFAASVANSASPATRPLIVSLSSSIIGTQADAGSVSREGEKMGKFVKQHGVKNNKEKNILRHKPDPAKRQPKRHSMGRLSGHPGEGSVKEEKVE